MERKIRDYRKIASDYALEEKYVWNVFNPQQTYKIGDVFKDIETGKIFTMNRLYLKLCFDSIVLIDSDLDAE
jgi:hypothetical protein